MVILAGEPRAIDDAVVVTAIYALWRACRLGRRSGRYGYVGFVLIGMALGAAVGAVQWLPGIEAVQTSQRAVHSTALFDSGSLAPKWLLLSIVPDLLGGSGSFGQPTFFAPYSLTEITGYVGLMPLVAAFGLLGRLRLRPRLPEWAVWHVVALIGVVLALGGNTVLGPVLMHLPLFGDQRLQSRNIMIADLALAVLLAYWVDVWLRSPRSARRKFVSGRQLLGIVPALAVVAVVTVTLSWGAGMLRWLGLSPSMANRAGPSGPWLVPFLVLGVVAIALVVWGTEARSTTPCKAPRRVRGGRRRDLHPAHPGVGGSEPHSFAVSGSDGTASPSTASPSTSAAPGGRVDPGARIVPVSDVVRRGRFAVYDPDQLDENELLEMGVSDGNVLTDTPSVEGYSSIVDDTYARVTGSHQSMGDGQNVLDPKAVADGTLDALDTTVLLTPSAYLVTSADLAPSSTDQGVGRRTLAARAVGLVVPRRTLGCDVGHHSRARRTDGRRRGGSGRAGGGVGIDPVGGPRRGSGAGLQVPVARPRAIVALDVVAGAERYRSRATGHRNRRGPALPGRRAAPERPRATSVAVPGHRRCLCRLRRLPGPSPPVTSSASRCVDRGGIGSGDERRDVGADPGPGVFASRGDRRARRRGHPRVGGELASRRVRCHDGPCPASVGRRASRYGPRRTGDRDMELRRTRSPARVPDLARRAGGGGRAGGVGRARPGRRAAARPFGTAIGLPRG